MHDRSSVRKRYPVWEEQNRRTILWAGKLHFEVAQEVELIENSWHGLSMKIIPAQERKHLAEQYPDDNNIQKLVAALDRSEQLLQRSLYEFGAELRTEIESFLDEPPLLPRYR